MVAADAVSALDEVLSRKEMQILKTPLCGYRTFADFLDATPYEHFHPTFPSAVCEPPKLRTVLPGVEEFDGFHGFLLGKTLELLVALWQRRIQ